MIACKKAAYAKMKQLININSHVHPGTSVFEQIFFVICHPQQSKIKPKITNKKAIVGTLLPRIIDEIVIFIHPINNVAHRFEFVQI
ncbi:hypothetical protein, partial [Vibrio parahaemolyticus]|uniref:hypothetical protein n=9 Tax=Vibrio parahaemolyticus TaxID=670 RepID=UPI001C5DDBB6